MRIKRSRKFLLIIAICLACSLCIVLALLFPSLTRVISFYTERTIVSSTLAYTLRWTFQAPDDILDPPEVINGLVFIHVPGSIVAVETATGQERWRTWARGISYLRVGANDDIVVLPSQNDREFLAINQHDGALLWSQAPPLSEPGRIWSLLVAENKVYIGSKPSPTEVRAYELQDGKLLWATHEPFRASSLQTMKLWDDELYVFIGNDLYVLDPETGALKRELLRKFGDGGGLIFDGQNVYLSYEGGLLAKDAQTGNTRWRFERECARQEKAVFFPTKVGRLVYAGRACQILVALDAMTGTPVWESTLTADTKCDVTAIGNTGYVILGDGAVIAFDLDSGQEVGRLQTNPRSVNPFLDQKGLATDGESLFITLGDKKLFAFGK